MYNLQDLIEMEGLKQQLLFPDSHEPKQIKKTATAKQVAAGEKGRSSGLKFEESICENYGGKFLPKGKVKSIHGKKTDNKTDVIAGSQRLSIKNPKSISTSTQIHITSVAIFAKKFSIEEGSLLYIAFQMFFGAYPELFKNGRFKDSPDYFIKLVRNKLVLNPDLLCCHQELRRARILFNNLTNGDLIIKFIQENIREIVDMCFRSGMIHPSESDSMATHVVWSNIKDDINDFEIINIQDILDSTDTWKVSVRPSQSVIEIGPITLQMKGSGKNSSYHAMQFNVSLSALLAYTNLSNPM